MQVKETRGAASGRHRLLEWCRLNSGWLRLNSVRWLLSAWLAFVATPALSEELRGLVVGVSDGDTVTVVNADFVPHKIRLSGIDAPEKSQPYGQHSKAHLARLLFKQEVTVVWTRRDRYGRIIGRVLVQPPDCSRCRMTLDAGLAQIDAGLAWWYRKFTNEQSSADRASYESAEQKAQVRRAGIWQEANPIPPWEWRRSGAQGSSLGQGPDGVTTGQALPLVSSRNVYGANYPIRIVAPMIAQEEFALLA